MECRREAWGWAGWPTVAPLLCLFSALLSPLLPVPLFLGLIETPGLARAHPALRARNPGSQRVGLTGRPMGRGSALKACALAKGLYFCLVRFNHICCLCSSLGRLLGFPESPSVWLTVLSRHKLFERMSHAYFKVHMHWSLWWLRVDPW